MTLSSASRQQRKSMLPKPRPSSRISARRVTSGDTTSRIARRVPSPLLAAVSHNSNSSTQVTTQAAVRAATDCNNLTLPEAGLWPGCASSPASGEAPSSLIMSHTPSPSPEVKKKADVNIQCYLTPPASAETKHERIFKGQEGRGLGRSTATTVPATQNQDTAAAAPARHTSRRPASMALTLTNTFSRGDNASLTRDAGDGGIPAFNTRKKSAFMSSKSSGKENRRPRMYTRVPPPPVTVAPAPTNIPPRSIRRTVARPPSRATSFHGTPQSCPLAIRKQPPLAATGSSPSASGAFGACPVVCPVSAGIQALIGDIDRFAKEWTEMFDELSAGAENPEDRVSKLDASSIRIRSTDQPEITGLLQTDNPAAAAAKGTLRQLQVGPYGYTASVSTLQASTLAGVDAETVHFDVTPASLTRWQHRDKSLVKDTPEDRPERDLPAVAVSASATDPQTDKAHHLLQRAVLRNASLQTTQASRHLPTLPEINQSTIVSGSHLVETTSAVLSNGKDEGTNLPQTTSMTPRAFDAKRRNGIVQQARCYSSATVPNVSSSPLANIASLSTMSPPYSSSPRVNLQSNDSATNATGDTAVPTRSTSLRGLRAIFKRTSAGLTSSQRQRAESLKGRISEPRVLSLGSISISNLRDAGVVSGCALPMGKEESTMNMGDLPRTTELK